MLKLKNALLAATIVAGCAASPAFAQIAEPAPGLPATTVGGTTFDGDSALHGAGSTAVKNVLARVMNCLGTPHELADGQPGVGTLGKVKPGVFAGSPAMTCNNESLLVNSVHSGLTDGSSYEVQAQSALTASVLTGIVGNGTTGTITYTATTSSPIFPIGATITVSGVAGTIGAAFNGTYAVTGSSIKAAVGTVSFANATVAHASTTTGAGIHKVVTPADVTAANLTGATVTSPVGFAGEYVATGSGFGRKSWYWFGDIFDSGSSSHAVSGVTNPFNTVGEPVAGTATPANRWSHEQYAYSDAPVTATELATYNTTNNAVTYAGPAVQFPLFVLPMAIAYASQYGTNASSAPMVFNTLAANGTASALNLSAAVYCGIFNGTIVNWNDKAIQKLNGKAMVKVGGVNTNVGVPLYDTVNDTLTRWTTHGVPIRLAGRMDDSGSTDVFSRHLAAVCSSSSIYNASAFPGDTFQANKFLQNAGSLPYDGSVNYTSQRSDTKYNGSTTQFAAKAVAGSTNVVSATWSNGTTISNLASGPQALWSGNVSYNGNGLYIVANGGGNLGKLIVLAPDLVEADGTTLNGKIGYISADFVNNFGQAVQSLDATSGLLAANLANPNDGKYYLPNVKNALTAFGGGTPILPPQSDATGAYVAGTDSRTVSAGTTTRDNPLAWTDVLYQSGTTLANPATGYPITGTTQFFGYTCYATAGNRQAIAEMLGGLLGQVNKDGVNATISKSAFDGISAATPGIVQASNISIVPAPWVKALTDTFLTKASSYTPNATDATALYIQATVMPASVAGAVAGTKVWSIPAANPNCGSLPGA